MMRSAYLPTSLLYQPLPLELCQRMHYDALCLTLDGSGEFATQDLPDTIAITELSEHARWFGRSALLLHPVAVQQMFAGITMETYRTVEQLYCHRLSRTIRMVWRILCAEAAEGKRPLPAYEAVWAICLFLRLRRTMSISVTMERLSSPWIVATFRPDVTVYDSLLTSFRPTVVCIIDIETPHVLALRVTRDEQLLHDIRLVLYDAICAERRPAPEAGGVVWNLPTRLAIEPSLLDSLGPVCNPFGIAVVPDRATLPLLTALQSNWTSDLPQHPLPVKDFAQICNRYLYNVHGHGPDSARKRQAYQFRHHLGYNRDPATQFPALRDVLPNTSGVIGDDGTVAVNGLHYTHTLLTHWRGMDVDVRTSPVTESRAWIYLDGDVLCEARARELRRPDGSYWSNRPWR